jgi:hypothetical protein
MTASGAISQRRNGIAAAQSGALRSAVVQAPPSPRFQRGVALTVGVGACECTGRWRADCGAELTPPVVEARRQRRCGDDAGVAQAQGGHTSSTHCVSPSA